MSRQECVDNCEKPVWVDEPGQESNQETKAFAGVSNLAASEQAARQNARFDAYKQAIDAMGLYGKRRLQEVLSNVGASSDALDPGIVNDEMTKLESEGATVGDVARYHTQTWRRVEYGAEDRYFKTYVLYQVNREELRAFLQDVLRRSLEKEEEDRARRRIERALEQVDKLELEDW